MADTECPICMESVNQSPSVKKGRAPRRYKHLVDTTACCTPCGHIFHQFCLLKYLRGKGGPCPICQAHVAQARINALFLNPSTPTANNNTANPTIATTPIFQPVNHVPVVGATPVAPVQNMGFQFAPWNAPPNGGIANTGIYPQQQPNMNSIFGNPYPGRVYPNPNMKVKKNTTIVTARHRPGGRRNWKPKPKMAGNRRRPAPFNVNNPKYNYLNQLRIALSRAPMPKKTKMNPSTPTSGTDNDKKDV